MLGSVHINVTLWWIRVTIVAMQTKCCLSVNNVQILTVAHRCFCGESMSPERQYVLGSSCIKCPYIFLSEFNQKWTFSTDFRVKSPISKFTAARRVGAALIHADMRKVKGPFRGCANAHTNTDTVCGKVKIVLTLWLMVGLHQDINGL